MSSNNPFGFDPEDLDRMVREAGEGLRDAFGRVFDNPAQRGAWNVFFDQAGGRPRARPEPETTGDAGDGVWAIYIVTDDGSATVEQVFATELDALRANKHNTDPKRKVRFLPYGIAVTALDDAISDETP
ncbi:MULTISPECIES: hypothetical protein [Mycolicibacterium]|jgi:hypothetical protein|uniref:Transmembrane protein n=2 Tax=Mycolicibacterium TaxID=1866885 RepID=A0A7I9WHY2_9MYCO|nr:MULTISPECIES: hypothetical protein [Mycolicibacterium]ANW66700.1 hypothetical protein BCA37_26800 [Mycobacterium sp. djl-10]MCV7185142.1 hypothetical protein [Mycolicibacterium murale]STZ60357.1 putative transmembrane protein [Mycolicibacterium tokaiense]BBY85134.1 hypothetical protein MTOK_09160 [Mycolicibacterium tokaiense]GFG57263.1 hypothetical protein MMUR_13990 [Mycolicibacterium murale]